MFVLQNQGGTAGVENDHIVFVELVEILLRDSVCRVRADQLYFISCGAGDLSREEEIGEIGVMAGSVVGKAGR